MNNKEEGSSPRLRREGRGSVRGGNRGMGKRDSVRRREVGKEAGTKAVCEERREAGGKGSVRSSI